MKKPLIFVSFIIFAFYIYAQADRDFYDKKEGVYEGEKTFDFKIRDWDLEFYNAMRSKLNIDCNISILQNFDGDVTYEKEYDMVKYVNKLYYVHEDDDRGYIGYQLITDLMKGNPELPDSRYYIDNFDIDIDLLDGLDKIVSVDVDYYTDENGLKKPVGFDIDTRTLDDDVIIDISYDTDISIGKLIDELNIIVINNLAGDVKPPRVWSHILKYYKPPTPKVSMYLNDRFLVSTPVISNAYAYPHEIKNISTFIRELSIPKISVSINEIIISHYLLREIYEKAKDNGKVGPSIDISAEVSPYVLNIWAVKDNIVLANYALGFTSTTRFKLIDERKFNLFLGVRSGYMYSVTPPIMFNIPMFGEIGATFGTFEFYLGAGGVYSGAYNSDFSFALEAGLGFNIPVGLHDKIVIGLNANIAKGYDTSDIKFIELYSANINPYIGYKYSFSYFEKPKKDKSRDGYVTIKDNESLVLKELKKEGIKYSKLSEKEVKERGDEVKKEPIIEKVEDIKPALKILDFDAGKKKN